MKVFNTGAHIQAAERGWRPVRWGWSGAGGRLTVAPGAESAVKPR